MSSDEACGAEFNESRCTLIAHHGSRGDGFRLHQDTRTGVAWGYGLVLEIRDRLDRDDDVLILPSVLNHAWEELIERRMRDRA